MYTEREIRMLGTLTRMHSAWTATSIDRKVTFSPNVVHKAVSAESILRYCLRQRGWTSQYKAGELSELEHVDLLKEIAGYCRAWLNHEARHFSKAYLQQWGGTESQAETTQEHLANVASVVLLKDVFTSNDSGPLGGRSFPSDAYFERMGNTNGQPLVWRSLPLLSEERGLGEFAAHAKRFFGRARQFIREGVVAAAMGLLGPAPLTEDDLRESEAEIAKQEAYLSRFEQEVIAGPPRPMTPDEFVARATSYGDSVYGAGQNAARRTARAMGPEERRVLGEPRTEHCDDCPELAARGWQPSGTLPAIGETTCRNNCYCHFRYRFKVGGPEFTRVRPGVFNPAK